MGELSASEMCTQRLADCAANLKETVLGVDICAEGHTCLWSELACVVLNGTKQSCEEKKSICETLLSGGWGEKRCGLATPTVAVGPGFAMQHHGGSADVDHSACVGEVIGRCLYIFSRIVDYRDCMVCVVMG